MKAYLEEMYRLFWLIESLIELRMNGSEKRCFWAIFDGAATSANVPRTTKIDQRYLHDVFVCEGREIESATQYIYTIYTQNKYYNYVKK